MATDNPEYSTILGILKVNKLSRYELGQAMGYTTTYFYGILNGRVKEPSGFKKKALEKILLFLKMREELEKTKQRVLLEEEEREEKTVKELHQQLAWTFAPLTRKEIREG